MTKELKSKAKNLQYLKLVFHVPISTKLFISKWQQLKPLKAVTET